MATVTGNITVSFTSNWTGNHTIAWTVNQCMTCPVPAPPPLTGTVTVACTAGSACTANIPITYDTPSCDIIAVSGTITPACSLTAGVPFQTSFNQDRGCRNYRIVCLNPQGCKGFDTTPICDADCDYTNNAYYTTLSAVNGSPVANDNIPSGAVFNLCYTNLQLPQIAQSLGLTYNGTMPISNQDWGMAINTQTPSTTESEVCCWECEQRQWTFDTESFPASFNPTFPLIYPTIYYTSCNSVREGSDPCFEPRFEAMSSYPQISTFQACVRKNSWTVLTVNSIPYVTSVVTTGPPCNIPPQYEP